MKRLERLLLRLSDMTFIKKMTVIYILCVVCPLLTISLYYYNISSDSVAQQKKENFEQTMQTAARGIEDCINNAIVDAEYLGVNDTVYEMLSTSVGDKYDFYVIANNIDSMVRDFTSLGVVDTLTIYCDNPELYRSASVKHIDDEVKNREWYKRYAETDGQYMVYAATEIDENNSKGDIIILFEGSHSYKYNREIIFKTTLNRERIVEILKRNALDGEFYLINEDNKIISSSNSEFFNNNQLDKVDDIYTETGYEFLTYELKLPKGYKMVAKYEKFKFTDMFDGLTPGFLIIVLINLIFASVIIGVISSQLSKRINRLINTMNKMSNQEFELMDESDAGKDEIGVLIKGTNNAIYRINHLIEKVYVAEIEKQDATLKALQSQINPHFMFNMLEVIRMNAIMKKETETAENIKNLSKMLRKIITWGKDIIPIREEMSFINLYLELQKYRFENECKIETDIDEAALDQLIPKMAIQVFVENAFVHGLLGDEEKLLRIKVKRNDDRVEYSVYDNGCGIDNETLEKIKSGKIMSDKNIGIMNVINRLSICFDGDYQFEITSKPDEYTLVKISIPYKSDEIY